MADLISKRLLNFYVIFAFLLPLLMISPNDSFAYSTVTTPEKLDSSNSAGPYQYVAKVENGEHLSTFKIEKEGKTYYEQTISFGYVDKVTEWNVENKNYYVVQYRYDGSGASMFIEVIEVHEAGVERVVQTAEHVQAVSLLTQDQLIISYGKYSAGDANAFPSHYNSIIYKYENNMLVKEGPYNGNLVAEKKNEQYGKLSSGEEPVTGENPTWDEVNKLLTEEAIKQGVPPELVKAIAWQETNWLHFYVKDMYRNGEKYANKGDLVMSPDGGIGIMQLTFRDNYYYEKYNTSEHQIKTDIRENIRVGISLLFEDKFKWSYIPGINVTYSEENPDKQIRHPEILENWYFAVMAYNGVSMRNDPRISAELRQQEGWPKEAYQDTIYGHMKTYGHLEVRPIANEDLNFGYRENSKIMDFSAQKEYTMDKPLTRSHHLLETDKIRGVKEAVNFRATPAIPGEDSSANVIRVLGEDELVYVVNETVFPIERDNHFIWYKVKTYDGHVGYVASAYIGEKLAFTDLNENLPNPYGYLEVSMLAGKKIINGYSDGTFKPNDSLSREHAAAMLVRALQLPIVDVEDTGFVDVNARNNYFYKEIAAAREAGVFLGVEKEDGFYFNPQQQLTRGEMAAILVRAYELTEPAQEEQPPGDGENPSDPPPSDPPPSDGGNGDTVEAQSSSEDRGHPFTDIIGHIFEPHIKVLYQNEITSGIGDGTEYGIDYDIKRVDFSRLLYKTIILKDGSIF